MRERLPQAVTASEETEISVQCLDFGHKLLQEHDRLRDCIILVATANPWVSGGAHVDRV
jgi:hypothetical protein